jgi:hypothetical protein
MSGRRTRARASPDALIDAFLAAPEEVISDERELKKLRERKARDAARLARECATKSKGAPSLEDILKDIVRVAEDEETNPWHNYRAVSRRRYELYGHYPIEYLLEHGRFSHLKKMAGLADGEGDRMLLLAREHKSKREHDERYYRRFLAPHVDRYPELRRATSKSRLGAYISDTHSMFLDPFTWVAFLAFVEDAQPDVIVWGGDHIDGSEITAHPQVPGHTLPLQVEIDCLRAMWREAREVCPRAPFVWIESNHFTRRLVRFITQHARTFSSLRGLRLDKLLEIDGLGVEIVQPGTFLSPEGQEDKRPAARIWDRWIATHGSKTCIHHAHAELAEWGQSGVSGHLHRHDFAMARSAGLRGKYYVKGNVPAWSRGFGLIESMGRGLQLTPVVTTEGVCMANGFVYEKRGRLPTGVEPVRRFWERRWGLKRLAA